MSDGPDDMVQCPECERWLTVIWLNDGMDGPEFCPMCGCEWDYKKGEPEGGE